MSQFSRRNIVTAGSGLTLAAAMGLARPARAQNMGRVVDVNAYSYMLQDPNLTIWVQLLAAAGLTGAAATAIYTVFPAADSAFAQFPGLAQSLLGYQSGTNSKSGAMVFPDTSRISKLVRSHVIEGKHLTSEIMGKKVTLTTIAGTELDIDATNPDAVQLHWVSSAALGPLSATLTEPPVTTVNAVIYVVNNVEQM